MADSITRRAFLGASGRAALGLSLAPSVIVANASPASTGSKDDPQLRAHIADLERQIPPLLDQYRVPGLSIAIVNDGKLFWQRGFGVKATGTKDPVDNDTVFELASVSKTVFAYVVLKLSEAGVLRLDTPLTKYTTERYLEGDGRLDLITARHVLTHTTGFQNWRSDAEPLTIHFTPGERFSYSGEGYSYLQTVVTHLTGHVDPSQCDTYERGLKVCATDFDAYMKARLLTRFGMRRSGYVWNRTFERHAAQPHDADGKASPKREPRATDAARYGAAGGLQSTATDYARYLIEVINPKPADGFRVEKETWAEMLRPQVKISASRSQALGWHVYHTPDGDFIHHGGGNPGFSCFVAGSVDRRSGVVVLTNSDEGYKLIDKLMTGAVMPRFLGTRMPYPLG